MRNLAMLVMVLAVVLLVAGCTGGPEMAKMPCESCKYGVSDKKANPPRWYCVVDGKEVDCRSGAGACPGCKK